MRIPDLAGIVYRHYLKFIERGHEWVASLRLISSSCAQGIVFTDAPGEPII
jgi:hypothetical protein